ncbi:MAG: Fpg/Nei family DNA glycosylase [Candidatus Brocadiales bacterium]
MPELPDVEGFKRYFKNTSLNKKIVGVECPAKDLIKKITFVRFKEKLIAKRFKNAWRRGKFLIIEIKGIPEKLVIHFGMTGNLHYVKQGKERGKDRFSRLIFKFENSYELRWLDMRKLGKVYLVKDPKEIKLIKEMGPEPLGLSRPGFLGLLQGHKGKNIKAFLLDQRDIAGIGNIYSDEILFKAQINPHRKIKTLNLKEKEKICQAMSRVLKGAIRIQPPSGKFGLSWLLSHRGKDMRCPKNKSHQLKREIIANRAATYCPTCQK